MAFTSLQFLGFMVLVSLGFFLLGGRLRTAWLAVACLAFYCTWGIVCLPYLAYATLLSYLYAIVFNPRGGGQSSF